MAEIIERDAIDDIKQSIATATRAIEDLKKDRVDEETVHRMIGEALQRSRTAGKREEAGFGYQPGDDDENTEHSARALRGRDRLEFALTRSKDRAAAALRVREETVEHFQRASDELLILAAATKQAPRDLDYYREEFLPTVRAMDTATAGEGLEYVPTLLSADFIGRVNLELMVGGLFGTFNQPSPSFDVPAYGVNRQRMGKHAEQTADSGQTKFTVVTPGTRKITFSAKKFAGEILVSKEAEEDAITAMLPWIQGEIVDYLAADIEDTLINGDTAGSHQDTDVVAATDPRKNWDGLRKWSQTAAKTDGANGNLTVELLRSSRKKQGKYAVRPADVAVITGIAAYFNLLSDANVLTVDKYGPSATVLSGELGKVDGSPLIVSEYVRANLNATGVYDGVTTNRSHCLTVNRKGFLRGLRRDVTIQRLVEIYAESDQDAVIASARQSFNCLFPTTEYVVGNIYNLAS